MVIGVNFKGSKGDYSGTTYSYKLNKNEKIPAAGAIIRMMDSDYNYIANGTRVKVTEVRERNSFKDFNLKEIKYVETE